MTSELGGRNAVHEPYVGPRPFEEEDRELFFGRDRDTHEVLGLLLSSRTFLIYAPSGAGKTSLLNAGLRPYLSREPVECWPTARVQSVISPSTLEQIANVYVFALLSSWLKVIDLDELARVTFSEYVRSRPAKVDEDGVELPLLIFIDQFEELFTSYRERWPDREAFFVQLHEALAEHPRLRLVFLMREDYLAHLDSYVQWLPDKLRSRFRLELLRERAALDAIRRPVASEGRSYAEGVAEQLVRELRTTRVDDGPGEVRPVLEEFVEPVQLQVTCKALWDSLPEEVSVITSQHLKDFGDVDQALTSFYDNAVRQVCLGAHVSEDRLRRGIEELFITEMGTRNMAYQGRSVTGLIPNKVVQMLEDQHVVRAEWRAGARWYELTHDRLISPIQTSNLKFFHQLPAETDPDRVRRLAKKAMAIAEQLYAAGRYQEALRAAEKGHRHFTAVDDMQSAANTLALMGDIHSAAGEVTESLQRYQESVKLYERLGDS